MLELLDLFIHSCLCCKAVEGATLWQIADINQPLNTGPPQCFVRSKEVHIYVQATLVGIFVNKT